jgi:hypothetical protein
MMREPNKRPRRNPLSSEEVSNIIAHKRKRELMILLKFKKSRLYKLMNVFNVLCIFVYFELFFCFFGPCLYQEHYSTNTVVHYSNPTSISSKLFISDVDIYGEQNQFHKVLVNDFIVPPEKNMVYLVGRDYLLQKELKGILEDSSSSYRLFSASPILFLAILAIIISFFGFVMNLNENIFTLSGITSLNFLVLLTILTI